MFGPLRGSGEAYAILELFDDGWRLKEVRTESGFVFEKAWPAANQ